MSSSTAVAERHYFLDWLRVLAFIVLVLYHVGMYYVSWDFHVKSPFAGRGLEPWMKLSEPWRMSLLFIISGASTAYLLKNGSSLAIVRHRSYFLLLPLLCGIVLIVPPQSYFQVVQKFGYSGDYWEFLNLYFNRYRGFCSDGHCLILPTWNHLWFLPYLWIYTLFFCSFVAFWPTAMQVIARMADTILRGAGIIIIPIILIFISRLTLFERYPSTHALWGDWFNHAIYLGMFIMGAIFATSKDMWDRQSSIRWITLFMAITFWALLVFVRPTKPTEHVVVAIFQWCALLAAVGFAKFHLNKDSPIRSKISEAVFPVYILHQTIIIVGSQLLLPFRLQPAIEGPLLILITFTLSYAGYEFVRRSSWLRPWFGLRAIHPEVRIHNAKKQRVIFSK
jgi:glucans biosynthesis protein C